MGKLVRDKIPNLIRTSGRRPRVKTLSAESYREALIEKLREEVAELATEQTSDAVLAEAADVLEVLGAIAVDHGATLDTIIEVAQKKRMERGGPSMRSCGTPWCTTLLAWRPAVKASSPCCSASPRGLAPGRGSKPAVSSIAPACSAPECSPNWRTLRRYERSRARSRKLPR